MDFDVVVVGAGHNGVIAAWLLARHGLRVAVVDRRYLPGGLAGGEWVWGLPGSRFAYAIGLVPRLLEEELRVLDGVVEYGEPSWVELEEDGEPWLRWWSSGERLRAELEEHGLGGLWELVELAAEAWSCMEAGGLVYTTAAPSREEAARLLEERCGPEYGDVVAKTARRLLSEHAPRWAWELVIYPSMLGASGFVLAYYLMNRGVWGVPRRGMTALSRRLTRLLHEAGVTIIRGVEARLLVEHGRAVGVRLEDGRELRARAVLYAASAPKLPAFTGYLLEEWENRELEKAGTVMVDVRRVDYLVEGRPTPPVEEGWRPPQIYVWWTRMGGGEYTYPTLHSGRGGRHLVTGSGWIPEPLKLPPPGVEEGDVRAVHVKGPREQERCCGNPTGHPDHLPMRDPWMFDNRPLPGWGDYRTSIPCLYHGSASSYPGGEVTFIPGVNAAARILLDMGFRPRLRLPLGERGPGPLERWGTRCM